jgi:hypothetical protein
MAECRSADPPIGHMFTKYSGMCFANDMSTYLSANKQLSSVGGLIQLFEIEHHRPNPRTLFVPRRVGTRNKCCGQQTTVSSNIH